MWNYKNGTTHSYNPRISLDKRRTMSTALTMAEKELGGEEKKLLVLVSEKKKQITSNSCVGINQECHMN